MLRVAVAAVGLTWCLQQGNARWLLATPAPAWLAVGLLVWCICGPRGALVLLAGAWTVLRADWLLEQHLPASLAGRDVIIRGTVCDFPRSEASVTRLVLEIDRPVSARVVPDRIHLSWYDDAPELRPGDRWQLRVRLKAPRGLANPGGFDFERWLYVRGIGASGHVRRSPLNVQLPAAARRCAVGRARGQLARRIEAALGEHQAAGYVLGIAVGATHRLTAADWDLLRITGTTHLLAISGLNIAMIAAPFLVAGPLLGRLCTRLAGRPHFGVVPAVLAAAIYSALSGFAISTVRALAMLCVAAALAVRGRRVQGVDLLGAAGIAIVALDPPAVMSISFWLSFLAVAWLFVAASGPERVGVARHAGCRHWQRARHAGVELGRAQLVLSLGLAPLTLAWFQQVSLIAPLTNLVAVPAFSVLVMPLALLGALLVLVAPAAGALLLRVAADVVQLLLHFLNLAAALPGAIWSPPPSTTAAVALAMCGAAVLCWWRPVPLRAVAIIWLLPAVIGSRFERPELRLTLMDVGQGLSVLVQTARHALLYDAGPAFRMRDAGESVVLPVLRAAGVAELDAIMISHADQDHSGGARTVFDAHPGAVLIAPERMDIGARHFTQCARGLEWTWDGVRFQVISPATADDRRSDNDGSCVLRIDAADESLLLPGDIERDREEQLVASGLLTQVDIVIAPHHGSRSSSSAAFVVALRPRWVLFSAGHGNRWGFPAMEVKQRWAIGGACWLETAEAGAIVFSVRDRSWKLQHRERIDRAHLWTAPAEPAECADDL